jgi:hypothetical protein
LYDVANDIAETSKGMMIAIPAAEWMVFRTMRASDMAATWLDLAARVRLRAFRKSPRGPKKPRPERDNSTKRGHVSTAKLLMNRVDHPIAP